MPTPKKGPRLGGSPAHQRLILSNLATSLFEHGRLTTTETKARLLRPYAERLITKAKKGDLHNRRQVLRVIRDKGVVHALFEEIAPTFAERPGGYTRITKIGPRKGDNAPMAVIELVTEQYVAKARPAGSPPAGSATPGQSAASQTVVADPASEPLTEQQVEAAPAADAETDAPVGEVASEVPEPDAVESPAAEPAADVDPAADTAADSASESDERS